MNNKEQVTVATAAAPPQPRAADATPPPPLPSLESLSPPSPPSRMANLLPWLGFTLVVALLAVLLVRQHRELNTPKDLSEPAWKKIEDLLSTKVSAVEGKADAKIAEVKMKAKEEAETAIVAQTGDKLEAVKQSSDKAEELKNKAAEALANMNKNVEEFNKAKTAFEAVTSSAAPLGPKMDNLIKSFGSLQLYLESLHTVDHEAVIVVCNGSDPSPARLESGLKEFMVSCPFPKLYKKYRWTILEQIGTKDPAELASSPAPGQNTQTVLKFSNSGGATTALGELDDLLEKWLTKRTAANPNETQRNLILLISENTHYVDFVPPEGFQRLNILLCLAGEPDAGRLMEWMKLCRKHNGTFDYVRLASGAPVASTPASGAASTKVDEKQAGAATASNATASTDKSPAAAKSSSPSNDPQAYALQFLLRVCQPLPNSR